jgi:hypothetical protein
MSEYCPGAVQVPQAGGGGLDISLPPRAVWHITWDALRADGSQPEFSAVANYLQNQAYCPHIMWNPFTGYMEQYYPASQSARALAAWNQDGAACVQIETFFTPGCVVDGVRYDTVADTPLKGFDTLLRWLDGLGIPRVWPMGPPQWQGNSRDPGVWNANGGHYGHCNVPDNTHTDPGPMPGLARIITQSAEVAPAPVKESEMPTYTRIGTISRRPGATKLEAGKAWYLKDKAGTVNLNLAAGTGGLGSYDVDLFLQGTGLPAGESITVQFALVNGKDRSWYFTQKIHGSRDGLFRGNARFKMPILKAARLEVAVTSSTSGPDLTTYGADVYVWQ